MKRVLVLSGPNLNLLGTREPETYGHSTLDELVTAMKGWGAELGLEVDHFQSNHEGALIEQIHAAPGQHDGLIVNLGALTHYSRALHDAIRSISIPTLEVHISNIRRREAWRRQSVTAPACVYAIHGRGLMGYRWALRHMAYRGRQGFSTVSYGHYVDQVGDLRWPADTARALVVLVHGGLWREEWTRDTMEAMAVGLTDLGYATWNLEYRRLDTGGGWPESFEDIESALRRSEELTGIGLANTAVLGHSAGGTMALWTAGVIARPGLAIGVAAITDMLRAQTDAIGGDTVTKLLGRRRPEPSEYSPRHRLPTGSRLLLVSGKKDGLVPVSYGRDFTKAAEAAGDEVAHLELDSGHMALIEPAGPAWEALSPALRSRIPLL
jgi:3-dehydroquinate dehydratase-2